MRRARAAHSSPPNALRPRTPPPRAPKRTHSKAPPAHFPISNTTAPRRTQPTHSPQPISNSTLRPMLTAHVPISPKHNRATQHPANQFSAAAAFQIAGAALHSPTQPHYSKHRRLTLRRNRTLSNSGRCPANPRAPSHTPSKTPCRRAVFPYPCAQTKQLP